MSVFLSDLDSQAETQDSHKKGILTSGKPN